MSKNVLQALKLAAIYVAAGLAWIYFSDAAVTSLTLDPGSIGHLQTLKGAGYVLFTGVLGFFLSWQALANQARLIERLEHYAFHNELTGLPNRNLAEIRLGEAVDRAHREKTGGGLLALDLDHFGDINESFGHPVGDELLKAVARRLNEGLSDGESVFHPGADEFLIIVYGAESQAALVPTIERVRELMSSSFEIAGDRTLHQTTSIGAAHFPVDASDAGRLFQYAQAALTKAKRLGANAYLPFEREMVESTRRQVDLEARLRRGMDNHELSMHYQPIMDAEGRKVLSYEALMRWQPADGPPVPPSEFIRAAEISGLIVTLGDWAMDEVCRQLAQWRRAGQADISAAVNLSARQFAAGNLPEVVRGCLERHGVAPELLTLEITESLLMDQGPEASVVLEELREIGVQLALDDFGTGYSSLAYLRSLPVDVLKIDRAFVERLDQSEIDRGVVATVIGMARIFGLTVVAEGVETWGQFAVLQELGCDRVQGFLFGRPAPAGAEKPAPAVGPSDQ